MNFELKPYNRDTSDDELIEDLILIAKKLNQKSFGMREYNKIGKFHSSTIARRFKSWNFALIRAGLEVTQVSSVSDEELIEDLIKVANIIKPSKVTQKLYSEYGKFSVGTINERFKWNNALVKAGLNVSLKFDISEAQLFANLEHVWVSLGHQPGKRDIIQPISNFSIKPYLNRFKTWNKALEAFIGYVNSEKITLTEEKGELIYNKKRPENKRKTKRDISERLKVKVLIRDGNKCRLCGITVTGNDIHFDHIIPWSKGGETELENIQVLCAPHNLAKGDYYDDNISLDSNSKKAEI